MLTALPSADASAQEALQQAAAGEEPQRAEEGELLVGGMPRQLQVVGSPKAALSLAQAVAEVERLSLQQRLRNEAAAQCLAVEALESQLRDAVREVESLKCDIEEHLAQVIPSLDQAHRAMSRLSIADLHELRMFARPPPALALALAAVCTALGVERSLRVPRDPADGGLAEDEEDLWSFEACMEYWPAARKLLATGALLQQMEDFDRNSLSASAAEQLRPLESQALFDASAARSVGPTAEAMVLWVQALLRYNDVRVALAPKKERFRDLSSMMEARDQQLAKELNRLRALRLRAQEVSAEGGRGTQEALASVAEAAAGGAEAAIDAAQDTPQQTRNSRSPV